MKNTTIPLAARKVKANPAPRRRPSSSPTTHPTGQDADPVAFSGGFVFIDVDGAPVPCRDEDVPGAMSTEAAAARYGVPIPDLRHAWVARFAPSLVAPPARAVELLDQVKTMKAGPQIAIVSLVVLHDLTTYLEQIADLIRRLPKSGDATSQPRRGD